MFYRMAVRIRYEGWSEEIAEERNEKLLAEAVFNWIDKKGRQPKWLLFKFRQMRPAAPTCPIDLTARDELIVLFDFLEEEKSTKMQILDNLHADWVKQQRQDKELSWYASAGKEKQKCEIAWDWYHEHHKSVAVRAIKFSRFEDILEFLDGTTFSQEEKLHHLEQIKRRFKAKQTQANRQGKRQTNLSLSDAARTQLDQLANRERMSKTEIIELLIQRAYEMGSLN